MREGVRGWVNTCKVARQRQLGRLGKRLHYYGVKRLVANPPPNPLRKGGGTRCALKPTTTSHQTALKLAMTTLAKTLFGIKSFSKILLHKLTSNFRSKFTLRLPKDECGVCVSLRLLQRAIWRLFLRFVRLKPQIWRSFTK